MKRILPILLVTIICLSLCACGATTITGNPKTYSNVNKSFSIDLPTANKESWVVNKDTDGDTLDIANSEDTINIQIQCLSKNQTEYIAEDLASYQDYAMVNILGELVPNMKFKDTKLEVPYFVTNSKSQSFTLKEGNNTVKGDLIFLESEKCFYTYLIMAIDKAYDSNQKTLQESVLSLKELDKPAEATEPTTE